MLIKPCGWIAIVAMTALFLSAWAGCDSDVSPRQSDAPPKQLPGKWDPFALLLIDVQRQFYSPQVAEQFPDLPQNVEALLAFCREQGIEVIHLRVQFKADMSDWPSAYKLDGTVPCIENTQGAQVLPFAEALPGETVIYKQGFDGFLNTNLDQYLQQRGKRHLLVAGVATDICVISTCLSAFQRGYLLTVLEDCCAGDPDAHEFILRAYDGFFFDTISYKSISQRRAAWLQRLGHLASIEARLAETEPSSAD